MLPLSLGRSVLIVAAHPDDEVLGCGATLAALTDAGIEVNVAFFTDGVGARRPESDATSRGRCDAAERACAILGVRIVHVGQCPDNQLDTVSMLDLSQVVERLVDRYQPELVLTHHAGDLNVDHRQVHQAVLTACRPQPGHPVKGIVAFEVASSTEWQGSGSGPAFVPNMFVDATRGWDRKVAALEAYAVEMRPWPHARSMAAVEALAHWRGATVGVAAAEAFVLVRGVI